MSNTRSQSSCKYCCWCDPSWLITRTPIALRIFCFWELQHDSESKDWALENLNSVGKTDYLWTHTWGSPGSMSYSLPDTIKFFSCLLTLYLSPRLTFRATVTSGAPGQRVWRCTHRNTPHQHTSTKDQDKYLYERKSKINNGDLLFLDALKHKHANWT